MFAELTKAEQPPPGNQLMNRHVDDKLGFETKSSNYRIVNWMCDHVKVIFATGYTGWQKHLGWDVTINKEERTVVNSSCQS